MCETFGQDPSRSIFKWFLNFMNCCNMFFHNILDSKLNVSDTAKSLATRIVWCCAHVWNFWARSKSFSFQVVSPHHELLQHVLPWYSWFKIECLRYCLKFGYQNSLMLCSSVKLLGKIRVVQFSNGFSTSWTAVTCSSTIFLIQNWMSQILLKVWLLTRIVWCCAHVWTFGQ